MNEEKYESIEELDEETEKFVEEYSKAYLAILTLLLIQVDKGLSYKDSTFIITQIDGILSNMDNKAKNYIKNVFTYYYFLSLKNIDSTAFKIEGVQKLSGAKHAIHREALKRATNDLYNDLAKNTRFMSLESKRIIRENAKELLTGMIESGESYITVKKRLREKLLNEGIASFKDATKRRWKIDRYVDMVIRTKSRILHNEGTMNRLKEYQERYSEEGDYLEQFDLIQISNHNASDWCSHFEDMVFSISGKSEYYPSIETLPNRPYNTLHPSCRHIFLAFMPALNGEGKTVSKKYQNMSINDLNKMDYQTRKKKK